MSEAPLKEGDRIRLIEMPNDPNPIEPGSEGKVLAYQDIPGVGVQITVAWDSGRTLSLVEIDKWEKIA